VLSDNPDQTAGIQMDGGHLVQKIRDGGFPECPLFPGGSKPGGIPEERREAHEEFLNVSVGMTGWPPVRNRE
jgi:hypothetical protein